MSDNPLIGRQLANFLVERVIGRGGMATVYYGQDVKLERPVAIKVINVHHRDSPTFAKRFIREAKTIATWRHEHIIHIYYADDEDGLYYFVMEYIDGPDLSQLMAQYVDKGQFIPHNEVLRIGRAVAEALDYAHQQKVIHRDIKPSNVMVAGDNRVVLTDFGLALDTEQGSFGEVFGTSHYIAPEQARKSADAVPQSDMYSLGVILYEMMTGCVPFNDPTPTAVAMQHINSQPPSPREINPNLSPEIEVVLLKALSKSPDERYQTGQEMLDALADALQVGQPDDSAKQTKESALSTSEGVEGGKPALDKAEKSTTSPSLPAPDTSKIEETAAVEPAADSAFSQAAKTTEDDLLGQQLDEYRLEELLGHGGMARVYRGLHLELQRYEAIKVIDAPFRSDSDYTRRFKREAQAVAQLEHPNIVRLYDYGQARGLLYMAMQYIEGEDLATILAGYRDKEEFMPPERISRIVQEICAALDDAHSNGVIHRDVKPSNIMVNKKGQTFLTDFGLALLTEFGTKGEIFGSPYYIAPEQAISSAGAVPQSDLYAVGVILYEMFTGQPPFEAESVMEVAMQHINEPPRPPREVHPDISPEVEAVILKVLAKDPDERYPDGAALIAALDEALQLTTAQEPAPPAAKTPPPSTPEPPAAAGKQPVETKPAPAPPPLDPEPAAEETPKQSLPPIPAAVATPPLHPGEPQPATVPPGSEPVVGKTPDQSHPPMPAAVATPASQPSVPQFDPATATAPLVPSTSPAPAPPSEGKRSMIYVVGIGLLLVVGVIIIILLIAILAYLLWPAQEDGEAATPTPVAEVISAVAKNEVTVTIEPAFTPSQLSPATTSPTEPPLVAEENLTILIVKHRKDGLFVIKQADQSFLLPQLQRGNDKNIVNGMEWGIPALENSACVVLWKDAKNEPKLPDTCNNRVGELLTRGGKEKFWEETFDIYYSENPVGSCEKDQEECLVNIPVE